MLFQPTILLLISWLLELSVTVSERGMLKSLTVIVDLHISLCSFISFCQNILTLLLVAYMVKTMSSWRTEPYNIK